METTNFDLHIQKSFSFSAFKESAIAFFSDDEDDHENDRPNHQNDINMADESSFIEIALDNKTIKEETGNPSFVGSDLLRISFSSSFPSIPERARCDQAVVGPAVQVVPSSSSSSSSSFSSSSFSSSSVRLSSSSLRSSSAGTASAIFPGSESFSLYESSRRRDHLPAFNPLVHTLLFSLEAPSPVAAPEIGDRNGNNHLQLAMINTNMINRKTSNVTPATNNQNGIMKLLMIKFRATKFKKLISSLFTRSRGQVSYLCNPNKLQNDISYPKRSRQTTHLEYYNDHSHHDIGTCYDSFGATNDANKSSSHDKQRRRLGNYKPIRAVDVNLGAVRGALEAVNKSGSGTRTRRKTSSCPSSIKSSPIHQGFGDTCGPFYPGENSIQAAIAHCKSSLGQSSEFRF